MYETRVTEANLELGGMRVRVDPTRVELQEHDERGLARLKQHVLISETHGVAQHLVAHEAPVHESELHVRLTARKSRRGQPTLEAQPFDLAPEVPCMRQELGTTERLDPRLLLGAIVSRGESQHGSFVAHETELDVEPREREILQDRVDVPRLRLLRALELAARRRIEKKIAYFDAGSEGMRRWPNLADLAAVTRHAPTVLRSRNPRGDLHARDGTDARQRLAAKSHRRERLEIVEASDLARCVARQGEGELVRRNAGAIVRHTDQPCSATGNLDGYRPRARVERILDELFDDGGRPLHDLARGDLVDELRRQNLNGH